MMNSYLFADCLNIVSNFENVLAVMLQFPSYSQTAACILNYFFLSCSLSLWQTLPSSFLSLSFYLFQSCSIPFTPILSLFPPHLFLLSPSETLSLHLPHSFYEARLISLVLRLLLSLVGFLTPI